MVLLATRYVGQDCKVGQDSKVGRDNKVGHALSSFMVLLGVQLKLAFSQCFLHFSDTMVDYTEIPLKLQL